MIAPVTCNCALHLVVIEGAFIVVDAAASQTQEVKLMDSIEPFPPLFIPGFRNRVAVGLLLPPTGIVIKDSSMSSESSFPHLFGFSDFLGFPVVASLLEMIRAGHLIH
jgi:hypothetical protein